MITDPFHKSTRSSIEFLSNVSCKLYGAKNKIAIGKPPISHHTVILKLNVKGLLITLICGNLHKEQVNT